MARVSDVSLETSGREAQAAKILKELPFGFALPLMCCHCDNASSGDWLAMWW